MSRYQVEFAPELQDDILEMWLRSDSAHRQLLTQLTAFVERTLADSADRLGRVTTSEPEVRVWLPQQFNAQVVFRLIEADRKVRVARITMYSKPR